MEKRQPDIKAGYADAIWHFFASLKLTVIVLLSLAVLSGIGTFLPQNQSPADYFRAFGPFWYQILSTLDLFDMYNAWWFRLLIMVLVINIIICSIDRLQAGWKLIFAGKAEVNPERFRRQANRLEFEVDAAADQLTESYGRVLKNTAGGFRLLPLADGFAMAVDKGRWTRLGVYGVHLSVVLLLIGSLIGSTLGFEGYVNIPEGETIQAIEARNAGHKINLPFAIRCDEFYMETYDTGAPKIFRSRLTILEEGRPVLEKDIIVNAPLRYKGINIFQSSYGRLRGNAAADGSVLRPDDKIRLSFQSRSSGMIYNQTTVMNETVELPEAVGALVIRAYEPKGVFQGVDIGPTLIAELLPRDGEPRTVLLPLNAPKFDAMRQGEMIISAAAQATNQAPRFYTGLQVTSDPGVGLVYVGFALMIIGCFVTFFMSHRQIMVTVNARGNRSAVMVSGTANKNKSGLETRLARLADRLKES